MKNNPVRWLRRRHLLTAMSGLMAACAPSISAAEEHIVEIRNLEFTPAQLTIAPGDTVTWINNDVLVHTSTADDGSWDSGSLANGDEWSVTFDEAGEFDYSCTPHPVMTGVIIVE